jgi:hypothetical protein
MAQRTRVRNDYNPTGDNHVLNRSSTRNGITIYSEQDSDIMGNRDWQEMTDSVVPDFHRRRAKGEIFMNFLSNEKLKTFDSGIVLDFSLFVEENPLNPGHGDYMHRTSGVIPFEKLLREHFSWGYGNFGHGSYLDPSFGMENASLAKAHAAVTQSPSQALVMAYEAKKTVTSLIQVWMKAARIIRKFQKKEWKVLNNLLSIRELAATWLEIRFVLRPLFYDMKGILETYLQWNRKIRSRYEGYEEIVEDEPTQSWTFDRPADSALTRQYDRLNLVDAVGRFRITRNCRKTTSCSSVVLTEASVEEASIVDLLGLNSVLSSAWEVVPYSFIVDYFLNFGNIIAALDPKGNQSVVGSCTTVRQESLVTWGIEYLDIIPHPYTSTHKPYQALSTTCSGNYTAHGVKTVRTANPVLSLIPSLTIPLDVSKVVDMIALIAQNARPGR